MQHQFNSGTVLTQTFSVFFANLPAFGLICLIVLSPSLIAQGWLSFQQFDDPTQVPWFELGVVLLLSLLTPVATAALTYGVFQHVRGKHADVGECMTVGLRRLLPVLGVSILTGLITVLGAMLCIVPGLIAATVLAAAVPAAVIERPGVLGALSRSSDLTRDYRWTVFGVIFGLGLLQMGANMVVGVVGLASTYLLVALTTISTVIFTGLQATAPALIYYHLRMAKESIDVEEIAAVFD